MKKIAFIIALFIASSMQGQISVSLHLGTPPQWGPAGYSEARYYYLPDVEAYYDIQASRFIYFDGRSWVHRSYLPNRYRNYDLYNGYKVVMTDYHGNRPYTHFRTYKQKYAKGYRGHSQRNIGVRPDRRNTNVVQHSNSRSNKNATHGNNKSNKQGHDKGHDKDRR